MGQWNRFEITVKGDRVSVVLNGIKVINRAQLPGIAACGPIALQHHGGKNSQGQWNSPPSLLQFKNIYIKTGLLQKALEYTVFGFQFLVKCVFYAVNFLLKTENLKFAKLQLKPKSITKIAQGHYLVDFGQNTAGFVSLSVKGQSGDEVALKYAEKVKAGRVDQSNIDTFVANTPFETDRYILKGGTQERWHARFTYHGFQYVEITGFPGTLTADNVEAHGLTSWQSDLCPALRIIQLLHSGVILALDVNPSLCHN